MCSAIRIFQFSSATFPRSLVVNKRSECRERPHRHSRGLQTPGSPLSPAIHLKHYAQFDNNFLAHACQNFKSRIITISFQTDEGLSISRNVFYQVLKISQCQTLSPLCQLLTTTTPLISECFRVHLLPLV